MLSQASDVKVTFNSASANWNDSFGICAPIYQTLGYGKSVASGTQYNLGQIPAGEVVMCIANPAGNLWKTGDISRNPDGAEHAIVVSNGTNSWNVGFEDIWGGGDKDFNDIQLTVTATPVVVPPVTPVCTTHTTKKCSGNNVYWYNSCDTKED